jgi:hypothetical protein
MTESEDTDTDDEQDRTAAEQRVIDSVAETHGEEWAEEHAALIVAQAKLAGEL